MDLKLTFLFVLVCFFSSVFFLFIYLGGKSQTEEKHVVGTTMTIVCSCLEQEAADAVVHMFSFSVFLLCVNKIHTEKQVQLVEFERMSLNDLLI